MSSMAPRPSWTRVPESVGTAVNLGDWLVRRFPRIAATVWRDRLRRGLVVDSAGCPLAAETPCDPGLRVGYFREVADEPAGPEAEIIEADEHLIVVDKPHFLPVTPSGPFVERCVLYQVEQKLGLRDLAPLHRLDRHTAGLVLLARSPAERGRYAGLFARGEIERRYEAIARLDHEPTERRWRVSSRIEPGEPFFRMREVVSEVPNAETEIELIEDWRRPSVAEGSTMAERWGSFRLYPKSGKKHQLRLHMAAIGCPIAGDRLYPELLSELPDSQVRPLGLVATGLRFKDPITGRERRFESKLRPLVGTRL